MPAEPVAGRTVAPLLSAADAIRLSLSGVAARASAAVLA